MRKEGKIHYVLIKDFNSFMHYHSFVVIVVKKKY